MKTRTNLFAMIACALIALVAPLTVTTTTTSAQDKMAARSDAKPTVVLLHADWCGACKKLAPTIAELKQQYGDRLNFVELDVTNEETTAQAAVKAHELGIDKFFKANQKKSSLVLVIGANKKLLFHTHYSTNREGSFERETYVRAFDNALAKG